MLETTKYVPAFANDPVLRDRIASVAAKVIGQENILEKKDSLGGEDFAFYGQHKPAAMFDLGVRIPGGEQFSLHTSKMRLNADTLDIPPRIFVQYVLEHMD